MSAGPYCEWCGYNGGWHKPDCKPPEFETFNVMFIDNNSWNRIDIKLPYLSAFPKDIDGYKLRFTDPNMSVPYYDKRNR